VAVGATPKTGARTSNFDQFIKFPILRMDEEALNVKDMGVVDDHGRHY
jgi:hypothetical protein